MTDPIDVGRLRLLREVAVRGTIAAAARSLGLSASAVSQQLAVLEREVGTAVLDRSPRGVALTGAGHLLAERAEAVLDLLSAMRADLDGLAGEPAGPVSIAAVASAAMTLVSAAARELATTYPGIELRVVAAEPSRAAALLSAGDVDVAVVDEYDYVPLVLPDYAVATPMLTESLVVVSGPGRLRGRGGLRLADLSEQDWVMPPVEAACGTAVRSACRAAGFEPDVRWETDDMLLLTRAVADGHGIAVLPRLAVPADETRIEIRPLRDPVLQRRITAVARASGSSRPVVRQLVKALATASR